MEQRDKFNVFLFRQGDEKQLSILNDKHRGRICQWVTNRYLNGDYCTAEDLFQQTLLKVWKIRNKIDSEASASRLMTSRMVFYCLTYLQRKKGRMTRAEDTLVNYEFLPDDYGDKQFVRTAIEHLGVIDPIVARVVHLFFIEDMYYKDIAATMNLSPSSVLSIKSRGIRELTARIKDSSGIESFKKPNNDIWSKISTALYVGKQVTQASIANLRPREKTIYRPFEQAREWARSLALTSTEAWFNYTKTHTVPIDIPHNPSSVRGYSRSWKGFPDFLGFALPTYQEALTIVKGKIIPMVGKVMIVSDYKRLWDEGKLPPGMPKAPDQVYRDKGWKDWETFLGKNKATWRIQRSESGILSYEEAKKYVKKHLIPKGIISSTQWIESFEAEESVIPSFLPRIPHKCKKWKKEWKGYNDLFSRTEENKLLDKSEIWSLEESRKWVIKNLVPKGIITSSRWMAYIEGQYPHLPQLPRGKMPADPRSYFKGKGRESEKEEFPGWDWWFNYPKETMSFSEKIEKLLHLRDVKGEHWIDISLVIGDPPTYLEEMYKKAKEKAMLSPVYKRQKRKITYHQVAEMVKLKRGGWKIKEIAKKFRVGEILVNNLLNNNKRNKVKKAA